MRDTSSVIALATLAAVLEGCASKKADTTVAQSEAPACAPAVGTLPANATLDSIVGEYRIVLAATSGPQASRSAAGTLSLARGGANGSLTGRAEVALETVGAMAPGGPPADGRYPVTALQWSRTPGGAPEITIRFGTATPNAIEGAHMALHLNGRSASGFTGTWTSGSGQPSASEAGGHFCATR